MSRLQTQGECVFAATQIEIDKRRVPPGWNPLQVYESILPKVGIVGQSQHANWIECIHTRKQPTAPVELGHRACSTCLLHHIAMKLPRHLHWDPVLERFQNDYEANSMLSRSQRYPYIET